MRVAVTADVHLRTRDSHPERYSALENILGQVVAEGIGHLIIAGDLFDKDFQNYSQFEELTRAYESLQLHIIPGNHDPNISDRSITGENLSVYTVPTVREIGSVPFLFIPYLQGAKMGEQIARMESEIEAARWILVGHGDFYGGVREPNPLEPGTYMPLSRTDVARFRPQTVFLGHIHKPHSPAAGVHYVGSPCGLDISETGRRQYLVYDTNDGSIDSRVVETDVLYFVESFLVLPRDDEVPRLEKQIADRVADWGMEPSEHPKVLLRVEARGYASNRSAVLGTLEAGFEGFAWFKDEGPRIENLSASEDDQLKAISERTMALIEELEWVFGGDQPSREQVELAALSVIYGK